MLTLDINLPFQLFDLYKRYLVDVMSTSSHVI